MKKIILSLIFIPIILLCALFFLLHLSIQDLNNIDRSWTMTWQHFTQIWYKSIPFYGFIFFTTFYIILMVTISKEDKIQSN